MYGWAVVNGHRLEVVGVHLYGGLIHLQCTALGPLPAVTNAEITFFGTDGQGVYQHPGLVTWTNIHSGDRLNVDVPFRIDTAIRAIGRKNEGQGGCTGCTTT